MESRRRAQTKDELNLVGNKEAREIEVAKNKELKRQAKKIRKKQELEGSFSYRTVCWISKVFDDCYLDGAIGLFQGVGDLVNTVLALPICVCEPCQDTVDPPDFSLCGQYIG